MIDDVIKFEEAHIKIWRKALKRYFKEHYELDIKFSPEIKGEEK